jgi:menaquinone-9 beta-reductase
MRHLRPLILGAGPAGCAAAIVLARAGGQPLLIDRQAQAGDALCGGFLSWQTAAQMRQLGVDPQGLCAHRVTRLSLFAGNRKADARLPAPAWGLSRRTLDNSLRRHALDCGAQLATDTIRRIEGTTAIGQQNVWQGESLFLATGKHDLRGALRPRISTDPALGLRLRLTPSAALAQQLGATIELHLFDGGYAGIVMQEDGTANLCLALRKSLLVGAGGEPRALLAAIALSHPAFAARLEPGWQEVRIDSLGAVPYGWIARETLPGLFRLGDQAAVIPSLAGEGMGIALASGTAAALAFIAGGAAAAPSFQRDFAGASAGPLRLAGLARRFVESPLAQPAALRLLGTIPALAGLLMEKTRVPLPA